MTSVNETLHYEASLPSLPVPPLKMTCIKYLESVRPCVDDDEFAATTSKVREFCLGVGQVLQAKLEEWASSSKNWLETWWEEYAYLKPRYPIAPTINPFGSLMLHDDIWPPQEGTQISRMAIVLYFLLNQWQLLTRQEYPIDGKDDLVLSMSQYYHLMSWCRIPGYNIDSYTSVFKSELASTVNYITVITRGRIYKCEVMSHSLEVFSVAQLEAQLRFIVEDASTKPIGPGLGSLTSERRDVWAKERDHVISCHPKHRKMLETIEKSIVTVVLEDVSPTSLHEHFFLLACGNCHNRWFDKSNQLIAFKNGLIGQNFDHAAFDGAVNVIFTLKCVEKLENYWSKHKEIFSVPNKEVHISTTNVVEIPSELDFRLDNRLYKSINAASEQFQKVAENVVVQCLIWNEYGKTVIKKLKFHPDSYIQMAIQLADYSVHKRVAPTYETASTRQFYHGRTETVRSHTVEAQEWCKAMENPNVEIKRKVSLLRIACLKHMELMREASNGLGIDRHLLGLKILAEEAGFPLPEVFTDSSWKKSGGDANFILSTSLSGYTRFLGGTLPMVEDGYGIFYGIQDNRINIVFSAYRSSKLTDCEKFKKSLKTSLSIMREILLESKL